jgi:hypothetical protein
MTLRLSVTETEDLAERLLESSVHTAKTSAAK